jgi:hypothetical protein
MQKMTDQPDWNIVELKNITERELPIIRADISAIYTKVDKIEGSTDKLYSINLAAIIAIALLALILWRLW